jgi:ABC-2 type transport system permease protein
VLAVLVYASMPTTLNYLSGFLPASLLTAVANLSILSHYESMQKGLIQLSDILFFIFLIIAWIVACIVVLDERKAG